MANETQMLKGILEGCILALLHNNELYGYKIVELLRKYGFCDIQEATVYPILNRLNKKGILTYTKRPSDLGPNRKYYKLSDTGKAELRRFSNDWNSIKYNVNKIIEEEL